ncbi:MAG: HD domain-containing protein [Tepidisphaera sp.]|nr:HD domain-containing protein [Tepidisphaera sp.]
MRLERVSPKKWRALRGPSSTRGACTRYSCVAQQFQNRPPKFRLRTRGSLVAATVLLQGVVIGLGCLATLQLSKTELEAGVRGRMMERAAKQAGDFVQRLREASPGPIRRGTPEWERAEKLVEESQPGDGATLMLLDQAAHMLCYPRGEIQTSVPNLDMSQQRLKLYPSGEEIELAQLRPAAALLADTTLASGPVVLAMLDAPAQRAKVLVLQPHQTIRESARAMSSRALLWTALAGAGVLVITVLGSILLVRRYDSILVRANQQLQEELDRRVRRGLNIRNALVFGLAKLADYRDTDTGRHLERICTYCELLAKELKGEFGEITRSWIENLKLASSMHDIGKVGVADAILLKPGKLSPEERRLMELHSLIGADTLIAIRRRVGDDTLINMAIQVALSHHERYDGTGYPYGLQGEQIPLAARIVALADMYDALTSRRVYKDALGHDEACRIIKASRGTHFDPRIADAFDRVKGQFDAVRAEMHAAASSDETPPLVLAVERAQAAARRQAA